LRILQVNAPAGGGSFRAAHRLHRGLLAAGEESVFLTQGSPGMTAVAGVIAGRGKLGGRLFPKLDSMPLRLFANRARRDQFELEWVKGAVLPTVRRIKPDIVHLHWVGQSLLRIEDLRRIDVPIVWTMHDMWTFTGGCLYTFDCDKYTSKCGACPQLGSSLQFDLSRWVWRRKAATYAKVPMILVSPSRWLADCAASSPLTRDQDIRVIPSGMAMDTYSPLDRKLAREVLGLPRDVKIVLFGALFDLSDKRKGFEFVKPALSVAVKRLHPETLELLIIGSDRPAGPIDLPAPFHHLGRLHDDVSLRLAYCAADVTVVPSRQESMSQMATESLACGTPVVAFNATGPRDIVDHGVNGYLAKAYDAEDLGAGIATILSHPDPERLRTAARAKAMREYSIGVMVDRYRSVYAELHRT
jgi:glycosyltransferase involved in cell wall biosynthesis